MGRWIACPRTVHERPCVLEDKHRGLCAVKPTYAEMIRLEAAYPAGGSGRDRAIDATHLPRARYYQFLNRMLEDPEAVLLDPVTVHRLQRIRDKHRADRARWFRSGSARS